MPARYIVSDSLRCRPLSVLAVLKVLSLTSYMHEGSPVFACILDASKAFDLVNYKILFSRLIEKGFPAHLTRFF